jgi:hypothetical protein
MGGGSAKVAEAYVRIQPRHFVVLQNLLHNLSEEKRKKKKEKRKKKKEKRKKKKEKRTKKKDTTRNKKKETTRNKKKK